MNLPYLFFAYSLIWLTLCVFLWRLFVQVNRLQRELDRLQEKKS
jgi:CcmD family protein